MELKSLILSKYK